MESVTILQESAVRCLFCFTCPIYYVVLIHIHCSLTLVAASLLGDGGSTSWRRYFSLFEDDIPPSAEEFPFVYYMYTNNVEPWSTPV